MLKPYFFKLSDKCIDGLSLWGPLLVRVSPTRISDFRYVPVVKITMFDIMFSPVSSTTPWTVLSLTIRSSTIPSLIERFFSLLNTFNISLGYVILSAWALNDFTAGPLA